MNNQIKDIQYLREKTGFGIMDCKKALADASGNLEAAYAILEAKGLQVQEKKADRCSEQGIVYSDIYDGIGVVVEVSAETDFVARSPDFIESVGNIAREIAEGKSTEESIKAMVMKFRENIQLKKSDVIDDGYPYSYMHGNGKYAVILKFDTEDVVEDIKKDLAMQIIALSPQYVSIKDIPADKLEEMKMNLLDDIKGDPNLASKPQNVLDKILVGRMEKIVKEQCLIEQAFIKDENLTVGQMLTEKSKGLAKPVRLVKFYRYEKAEASNKCPCADNMFIG